MTAILYVYRKKAVGIDISQEGHVMGIKCDYVFNDLPCLLLLFFLGSDVLSLACYTI